MGRLTIPVGEVQQESARSNTGDDGVVQGGREGRQRVLDRSAVSSQCYSYRYKHVQEVAKEPKLIQASHYQNFYIVDKYLYIARA